MKLNYLFTLSFQYDVCYNSGNLFLEAKLRYLSRGLYVFPNKNTIRRFMYDGEEATELPEITFEQQLIDFLEIDLTPFNRLLDKLKAYTKENTTPDELLSVCRAVGYTADRSHR